MLFLIGFKWTIDRRKEKRKRSPSGKNDVDQHRPDSRRVGTRLSTHAGTSNAVFHLFLLVYLQVACSICKAYLSALTDSEGRPGSDFFLLVTKSDLLRFGNDFRFDITRKLALVFL